MLDFEIQRCTRRCAATDRELRPDEEFYSVLVAEGGQVVRLDYAEDGWPGPPERALGWWKSRMPPAEPNKKSWAPSDVMLDFFQQLADRPDQEDLRYVLALLMTRRKILRHETTEREASAEAGAQAGGQASGQASGQEWMVLFCPRNEQEYRVKVAMPGEPRAKQIQEELTKLLQ